MAIPDYQTVMLPLLKQLADNEEHSVRELVDQLAGEFGLADSERQEMLPSGTALLFDNRVGWARTYLKKAGLIVAPKRGAVRITDAGLVLLDERPEKIDVRLLERFEDFRAFRLRRKDKAVEDPTIIERDPPNEQTPEDALAEAYTKLRNSLEEELLDQVKRLSPAFFERMVIDLLVAMGYGGSREDAGRAIGRAGDGGIDGVIKEDRLGLDVIYVQAKRWEGTVGRPEVQKFAGALQGQRAAKGVFITTSSFTKDAEQFVTAISSKIILLDGSEMAKLMVDHGVGVTRTGLYEIKKIDGDYFEED